MTRYDTFILYAFIILLLIRLLLAQVLMRARSQRILPYADLNGQRYQRGKGVTLLVDNHWLMGRLYGQYQNGKIIVRSEDGSFTEVAPGDIETARVYDV